MTTPRTAMATLTIWAAGSALSVAAASVAGDFLPPVHPLVAAGDHHLEDHSGHSHPREVLNAIDLAGANLAGASFFSSDLTNANLAGAHLVGANLRFADLTGASLVGADLTGADLRHAVVHNADLTGANCASALLGNADFTDAIFAGVNLVGATLQNVNFTGVNLSGFNFDGMDLRFANLSGANLSDASLEGANLTNVIGFNVSLVNARLVDATLINARLSGADLTGANLLFANLSDATLSGAICRNLTAPVADFNRATMMGVDAVGAIFFASNLGDADLHGSDLAGSDLRFATLRKADFTDVNLFATDLNFADFYQTFLFDSDLSGADLTNAVNLAEAFSDQSTTYRCDTNFTGTEFDPVVASWTLLPPPILSVLYVDGDGPGGCGTRWSNAFAELSDALALAAAGRGDVSEIWVAAAANPYRPGPPGDRSSSFAIPSGVTVYGGFSGTESSREQRDPRLFPTLLSGDLAGDDVSGGLADNAYHVVTMADGAGLFGVHVMAGRAVGPTPDDAGAGILVTGTIRLGEVTLSGHLATRGAAIFAGPAAEVTATSCVVRNNAATWGGAWSGDGSTLFAVNCVFSRNSALLSAGAIQLGPGSHATLVNSTLSENVAGTSGGAFAVAAASLLLDNSIAWGDTPDEISTTEASSVVVRYSIVQGGWPGGNLDEDPLITNSALHLAPGSPAIDAGDSTLVPREIVSDVGGHDRFWDDLGTDDTGVPNSSGVVVDLGAWEFGTITPDPCPSDVDDDGEVGFSDLVQILSTWGECPGCPSDLDESGIVEFHDLLQLLADWGLCR